MDKLRKYVDEVKLIFSTVNVDVPFYIAGGSVYSTLKGLSDHEDVDIFFYSLSDSIRVTTALQYKFNEIAKNKNHLMTASDCTSKNALTLGDYVWENIFELQITTKFQFITLHANTVEEMFKSFDLNVSKFAYTSEYEIVKCAGLKDYIVIDFKNFKANSVARFAKYVLKKKCIDNNNVELHKIVDHLVENFYDVIPGPLYDNEDKSKGYHVLRLHINSFKSDSVYNAMCKRFKNEELIQAFKILDVDFELNDACVEYIVYYLEADEKANDVIINNSPWFKDVLFVSKFPDDKIKLAHSTYPEYFI